MPVDDGAAEAVAQPVERLGRAVVDVWFNFTGSTCWAVPMIVRTRC